MSENCVGTSANCDVGGKGTTLNCGRVLDEEFDIWYDWLVKASSYSPRS